MGLALALSLAILLGAHLALAAGLARQGHWLRAALALVVPPLAPWWGWRAGLRAPTIAWGAALGLYVLGVALS